MPRRRLGAAGPDVSVLAYGNWRTHGEQVRDQTAVACVRAALEAGITTFDTADEYAAGAAETLLGTALADEPRESVQICTKVFFPTGSGSADGGLSRRHILASCDASLRRLHTDYIDLYQAHRFDPTVPVEETIEAFGTLVEQGKVRYVGVSEWTTDQLTQGLRAAREIGVPLVANQVQYSLLWRVPEQRLIPFAERNGLGHLCYSPLAQGVLTGKYRAGEPWPDDSRAGRSSSDASIFRYLSPALLARVARARDVVAEAGLTLPEFCLAWVLRRPTVSTVILGGTRPDQIQANAAAVAIELDFGLVSQIDIILGDLVETDPGKTGRGWDVMPNWKHEHGAGESWLPTEAEVR